MNPFSPTYFIKENKTRCILLIFMIFLGFSAYLGGLYITNPLDNWRVNIEYYNNMVSVSQLSNDENGQDYKSFIAEIIKDNKVEIINLTDWNGFSWGSIMGFDQGQCTFSFNTVDDFKAFCEYHIIDCDFDSLKYGSMIMSEKFAKNKGLNIGEKINKDYDINIYGEFTLDAVTKEDGYTLYFINSSTRTSNCLLLGTQIKGKALYDYVNSFKNDYNVFVYKGLYEDIKSQFEMFNMIYIFIVILMAIIMAVTINAAFVGMYQRRTCEFAVYRAIGISKKQIIKKIAGELLFMDLISLIIGGGVFFISLYLFNNMVLYPVGKYLKYYHSTALFGLLLCNVMVVIPLILTRCKRLLKADICEY